MPLIGQRIRTIPAAMLMTADTSDHQKPGTLRIQNVVTRPTPPATRNIQPITSVKASVAICGTMIAAAPRMTSTMPSNRNRPQWAWMALATERAMSCSLGRPPGGPLIVIVVSLK